MAVEKKLDKKLYQEWYQSMRQWNEAELIDRIRNARKLTPQQGWEQFVALVEFCWKLAPPQSDYQRKEKLETLRLYYERIQKFEAWRQTRGKWKTR
jgi:hypothetical protein